MVQRKSPHDVMTVESIIEGELVEQLADLASVWADLMLVDMSLHERKKMTERSQIFARRALWEQAVIAYGRCFKTGRRRQFPNELLEELTVERQWVHQAILTWRDKHVAHRVSRELEWTTIALRYPYGASQPEKVAVRIETPLGPENDDLVAAFGDHVKGLRDRLWQMRFPDLEAQILDTYRDDEETRSRAGPPTKVGREGQSYGLTINP